MSNNHAHTHHHPVNVSSLNRAFIIGIILNLLFVMTEFSVGFWIDSLALISDAGHNLTDVVSLVLALIAFRLSKLKSNEHYTYGYKKSTVLVSLLNAFILLIAVGAILIESIGKLMHPTEVAGGTIAWVAAIGVVINGLTAYLFNKDRKKDLNVKGAYLHMVADALVSIGVVISGIVISQTGLYIIDPIIGIVVAIVILISTWNLLHDSIRLSLDGVPVDIEMNDIVNIISHVSGVTDVHHLHIWAISTTEIALTAHVSIKNPEKMEEIKDEIKEALKKSGIGHTTLEFEFTQGKCTHCNL